MISSASKRGTRSHRMPFAVLLAAEERLADLGETFGIETYAIVPHRDDHRASVTVRLTTICPEALAVTASSRRVTSTCSGRCITRTVATERDPDVIGAVADQIDRIVDYAVHVHRRQRAGVLAAETLEVLDRPQHPPDMATRRLDTFCGAAKQASATGDVKSARMPK